MKKSLKMRNPKYPLLTKQNKLVKSFSGSKEGIGCDLSLLFSEDFLEMSTAKFAEQVELFKSLWLLETIP